jgi:hypothetical protein
MCHPKGKEGHSDAGIGCCCEVGVVHCGPGHRHFFSKQERRECLESYRDQLKKELAGLEERIREIEEK